MLSEDMYQENILEHYKHPHNFGMLKQKDIDVREVNPLCGDVVEMQIILKGDVIEDIKFHGKGCAISQAATSMLTDEVKGKTLKEATEMTKQKILGMLGVEISPVRQKCAFLGLKVLHMCLEKAGHASSKDSHC